MSSLRQIILKGCVRARVPSSAAVRFSNIFPGVPQASRGPSVTFGSTRERWAHGRYYSTETSSSKLEDNLEGFRNLGCSPQILNSLAQNFPSVQTPTRAQQTFLKAMILGDYGYYSDSTGTGKTFALVLGALSLSLANPTTAQALPRCLILLPTPELVTQVSNWISQLSPPDEPARHTGITRPGYTFLLDSFPDILIGTPTALLGATNFDEFAPRLGKSLRLVAVDEVDAIIRPLPGKSLSAHVKAQHPFYRHPPPGVELLSTLLEDAAEEVKQSGRGRIQTVFLSATLNFELQKWIFQQGWVGRGESAAKLITGEFEERLSTQRPAQNTVKHYCLVVDPKSGALSNLQNVEVALSSTSSEPGQWNPLLIEGLALAWAQTTGASVLVTPEGLSLQRLEAELTALGVPTYRDEGDVVIDSENILDPDTQPPLRILSRNQIRGLDLPNLRNVFILGGLGTSNMSKALRQSGGLLEKEREFRHLAGRVGRLGQGDGEKAVFTIVMGGGEEEVAMRRFMGTKGAPEMSVWLEEGDDTI